jgi:hypothetical protein
VADLSTGVAVPVADFAYGPLGERIRKTVPSSSPLSPPVTRKYIYDEEGRILETRDGANVLRVAYVGTGAACETTNDGDPIVIYDSPSNQPAYVHRDDLGNVLALTGPGGNVIERYDYDDFGAPRFLTSDGFPLATNASPTGNLFLFGGLEWDAETGFYHGGLGNYFDPEIGRSIGLPKITPKISKESHGKFRLPLVQGNNPWSNQGGDATWHTDTNSKGYKTAEDLAIRRAPATPRTKVKGTVTTVNKPQNAGKIKSLAGEAAGVWDDTDIVHVIKGWL